MSLGLTTVVKASRAGREADVPHVSANGDPVFHTNNFIPTTATTMTCFMSQDKMEPQTMTRKSPGILEKVRNQKALVQ